MKTLFLKLLFVSTNLLFIISHSAKEKSSPPNQPVIIQFYSMYLSKTEIKNYIRYDNDRHFKRFIIQFYEEQSGNNISYKMRGWILKNDLTPYPNPGNLLVTGEPITTNIPAAPVYFSNCELKIKDFKTKILDQIGGLKGDWENITLTPIQTSDGYLQVEFSVDGTLLAVTTIANPCPPKKPQG